MIIFPLIVRAIRHLVCNDLPPPPPPKPFPTEAEIDAKLSEIAAARGLARLNWKQSIVDLLTLLEIKNDANTRALLWNEMGGASPYQGLAEQNVWMIEQVRQRFAAGKID
jgi:hypothetical protein